MIDASGDGLVDSDELKLALLTDEDIKDEKQMQSIRTDKGETTSLDTQKPFI